MNTVTKFFFWSAVILLGFINPLISVAMIILYYLPKIISDSFQQCKEVREESGIKFYAYDVLEENK